MTAVSLGFVDLDSDFEKYNQQHLPDQFKTSFHENICKDYISTSNIRTNRSIAQIKKTMETNRRIVQVTLQKSELIFGSMSGKAGVKYEWGDKDEGGVSGYIKGSASDDNGNTVEVEVNVENDGTGSVSAEVSHDK